MKILKEIFWYTQKDFRKFVLFLLFSFLLIFISCSDEPENFGKYYTGTFNDEIVLVSVLDTINIVLEQLGVSSKIKEDVPYSLEDDLSLSDSIKLRLFVSFGSYDQKPTVIKESDQMNDSVYVWYSTRNKFYKILPKSNGIVEDQTSPEIEYVSVDSVMILKAEGKFVKLFSRIIK